MNPTSARLRLIHCLRPTLAGLLLILGSLPGAWAGIHSYLVDPGEAVQAAEGAEGPTVVKMAVYINPLKTVWMAWSAGPKVPDFDGQEAIDGGVKAADKQTGYLSMSLVSPWGNRSEPLFFGRVDAQGRPLGAQALVFGNQADSPNVARRDEEGVRSFIVESGAANEFIETEGEGYYVFELTYTGIDPEAIGPAPLYLLVRTHEDYRQPFPYRMGRQSGGMYYDPSGDSGSNGDDNDDDDSPDDNDDDVDPEPTPTPFPTPYPTPQPTPTPKSDDEAFFPPQLPGEPVEPVIPEPATLALIALGLGGVATIRRRRS